VNLAAHTHVYFGIRNDSNVNGNTMTGTAPTSGSGAVFRFLNNTASSISYDSSQTTIADQVNGTQVVNNSLVLTLTAGSATVVSSGGIPGNNGNGDIAQLFQINSGSTFSIRADVKASDTFFGPGYACTSVYDPTRTPLSGASDISKVDVAFYYSDCGDGTVDSPEQCDEGSAVNGTTGSCCTATCTFRASGQVCRPGAGAPCDNSETCTGTSSACPPDDALINKGVVCRTGSGDICDQNETCTGIAGQGCPPDDAPLNAGVICRLSSVNDICDESETCTGVPGATCPPDDAPSKVNVVCRPGSGDICDPDEKCTGIPGEGCPQDIVANPSTVCRHGSGDFCDPDEHCTAIPTQPCPADVVEPSGTVCRPAAGTCDIAESCTGTAGQTCPPNAFQPATTSCDADNNVCTVDHCDGSGGCVFGSNLNCDDGNSCTQDSCDPQTGCVITGAPSTNCTSATKALLKIRNSSDNTKDGVKFLWKGGPALVTDMGNPTQTTRYELCIYDNRGVQMAMGVPAGNGWTTVGQPSNPKGFKYNDPNAATQGVKQIKTKGSNLFKGLFKVFGKGDALPDTEALPFQFPVTAQIYADGKCWEAQFDQAQTKKNEDGGFGAGLP
jgi:hypothetical protein